MRKKNGYVQTSTRLFSLQLAHHDSQFAPVRKKKSSCRSLKTVLILVTVLVGFSFPSFRIGRPSLQTPPVALPESLEVGELLTIPAGENGNMIPMTSGRPLGFVDGKTPLYVAAAIKPFGFEISFDLLHDDPYARLKVLLPRLENPVFPVVVGRIKVREADPAELEEKSARSDTFKPLSPPPISAEEASIYNRFDGKMRLRCWRQPVVEPLAIDPLRSRRNQRLGKISAAGPGEVVYTSPQSESEKTVVIYHGGGLFTRYWGIKELRLPKDGRVTTGQTIGHVPLAPPRQTTPPYWQAIMNGSGGHGDVNREDLLNLSSRLCDST